MLGQPFMPWQQHVADIGCEIDQATGYPAYREVVVTVPRQSGKTTMFVSWQADRCLNWGKVQRSAFTAQSGKDARDKWVDEIFPLLKGSKLAPLLGQTNRGMGNESVSWKTGSIIRILSTSASSGHSKTLHQAVMDEIWHDTDDRREQGLRPAMITVPDAQLLVCSTAGTHASTVLNRKVQAGRLAVAEDKGSGIAYFEWSAPDDWDPTDESTWWSFMPALGHTIGPDAIRTELASMDRSEFIRAYGNRPTGGSDVVIPPEIWRRVIDPTAKPSAPIRFGLDVSEDRASSAIVACGANNVLEVIEHRPGTGWVRDRANELAAAHDSTVALDFGGPAGVLADGIERCERMQGRDVIQACGAMYDAIVEATVTFRQDDALDAAVNGVVKKPVGDQWVWSRKASVADVTPLMAATLARGFAPTSSAPLVAWR